MKWRKKINGTLVVCIVLTLIASPLCASASNIRAVELQSDRFTQIVNIEIEKVKLINDQVDSNIKVCSKKQATDFAGNEYTIIECDPTGYMIYNVENGLFCEIALWEYSPYMGYDADLYYCGPTYYYRKVNNEYIHLLDGEERLTAKETNQLIVASNNLQQNYKKYQNEDILRYIRTGNVTAYNNHKTYVEQEAAVPRISSSVNTWFRNLKNCGYISGGKCGFIALNILYAYYDKFYNDSWVDNKHWTNSSKTGLKSTLSEELYSLSPKSSTTAMHIEKVSKLYAEKKGISVKHETWLAPIANIQSVRNKIDQGYPVAVFGSLSGPTGSPEYGNHAVVAFDTVFSDSWECHLGYNNRSTVYCTGVVGSYYILKQP